ncbi:MAG: ARPP-1 family domain-containing protein [Candidatus Thorarchaeota archaeon]
MSFQELISNLGGMYNFGDAMSHDQFTVFPILSRGTTDSGVLGIMETEEKEQAWIQETEGSERVDKLLAVNKTEFPVLIPYLHQVEGGKQDRTIFEPILVPSGYTESQPLDIPAKCIEQSRWTYRNSRGAATSHKFRSAKTRLASHMANISTNQTTQGIMWDSIAAASSVLGYGRAEAPTSSFREIQEHAYTEEKDLSELLEKLTPAVQIKGQVGLVAFYGGKILGVEIYGSPNLWPQFSELVLKGFLADWMFLKEKETKGKIPSDLDQYLRKEFSKIKITKDDATGAGQLYRFSDQKWQGICIQYEGVPLHLYAAKEHIDILKGRRRSGPGMVRRESNVIETAAMQQTISNRMAPGDQDE